MKKLATSLSFVLFLTSSFSVFAVQADIKTELEAVGVQFDLARIVSASVNVAILLGSVVLLGYFVIGAYKWLTAGGDAAKIQEAKDTFTNGLIGMALLASVIALSSMVNSFFGINPGETVPVEGLPDNTNPDQFGVF